MSNETDTEIATQTTPEAGDSVFQSQKSQTISTPGLNTLSSLISSQEAVDPITEAIRKEILEKQRDVLRDYFLKPENLAKLDEKIKEDLDKQLENDEKFREFLKNLKDDEEKRKLINAALNDPATKEKFEAVEIAGYKKVHTDFKDSFKTIAWDGPEGKDANENITQSQKITNDVDGEICTLTETTHATKPISVTKSDGTEVKVNSYRTIDFPVKLNGANGNMHLSIVALDENGKRPPIDKAVYFTAHYEEGPNGKPLLKEVSSPMPIKFMGEGKDAIGYVEHGGKIYTMPVTRGKYEEMMQEVALNKGQGVDLSQTVQEIANDQSIVVEKGGETPTIQQNKGSEIEPTVAPNPIENKAEIEQVSPPSPPPIPPRPKPLEPEGRAAHDDTPVQGEIKSEPVVSQISSSHPVKPLSPEISQPLPAKSDSEKAQQVEAQAAQLMANLEGSSSSRLTKEGEAKQKFYASAKAVIGATAEVIAKADGMKNILSSSAPVISSKSSSQQIINEKELSTSKGISKDNKGGGRVR